MDDEVEQQEFIYHKKLRRHVPVAESPPPGKEQEHHEAAIKIARPIPITPVTRWLFPSAQPPPQPPSSFLFPSPVISRHHHAPAHHHQPSGLLSHHGFTPPRVQQHYANSGNSAAAAAATILLSPEVELTRVNPSAVTIILSDSPRPPLAAAAAAAAAATTATDPSIAKKRRQKPDDLVPPGCGLSRNDIVCLPIDDFNDKVADKSEKEILVLKDRRRRGKNRIAAKRSRDRKVERMRLLKDDNDRLTRQREETKREKQKVLSTKDSWVHHLDRMEAEIKRLKEKMWRMYEKRS